MRVNRVVGWMALLLVLGFGVAACGDKSPSGPDEVCGDGLLTASEACDGSELGGATCASLGLDSGELACGTDCAFDVSGCAGSPVCGNDTVEFPEACDGADLAGETCVSLGWDSGDLGCGANCQYDTSACVGTGPVCGDGQVVGIEVCDDGNTVDCDGCRGDCTAVETGCGDGFLCGAEQCDDGNVAAGDGCGPTCLTEECGNGIVDPGELCDDGNLISCDGCEVDCMLAPGCGNGVTECSEECDDGNMVDTDGCLSSCLLARCGDGIAQVGVEECDQADFVGETCVTLGYDGGPLSCTANCNVDQGACVDCPAGLTYCVAAGACVDLLSDSDHCNACGVPCGAATVCSGGLCQQVSQPWSPVAMNPVGGVVESRLAHDLATDGTQLTVALVENAGGGNRQVRVLYSSGGVGWFDLGLSPSGAGFLDEAVSLAYDGATPFVAFGGGAVGPWGSIHVASYQAGAWTEVGAPGFPSACGMHMFIDLALDGSTPHLTSMGAGGCGIGVDYGWFDGVDWLTYPSATGFPGQLTMNGQGNPAIVYGTEPLIGLVDWDSVDSTTIHSVKRWDGGGNAWADLDGELDLNLATGWQEHMALALDPWSVLYTAWVENDGGAPAADDIYVKRHDATAGTWSLLGAGEINGVGSATLPSIAIIGTTPWVAYVERSNLGFDQILVRRFDPVSASWQLIGQPLNEELTQNATAPVIVSMGGAPYVAFREEVAGVGSARRLYVKTFP